MEVLLKMEMQDGQKDGDDDSGGNGGADWAGRRIGMMNDGVDKSGSTG